MDHRLLSIILALMLSLTLSQAQNEMDSNTEDLFEDNDIMDVSSRILKANKDMDYLFMEGDIMMPTKRNAIKCYRNRCLWPKTSSGLVEVPYLISDVYNNNEEATIKGAMQLFHTKTCIRFVPYSGQKDLIAIESKFGCASDVGKYGYRQDLSLSVNGCIYTGIIQHELTHALGFYHEHTRSDRDEHVKINFKNIQSDRKLNFRKRKTNNLDTPYDYSSLMHYSRNAFAIVAGMETITPIPDRSVPIGQRYGLSDIDILKINKLYDCKV